MFTRSPRDGNPEVSPSGICESVICEKKSPGAPYSPVVLVLQPHSSPKYTTPLRCKDFYTSSNEACRICHEDDTPDTLISPCNCMGSLGRMHKKCLEKWLSMSNTDRCEICKCRFQVVYRTRPIWQWLISDGPMGPKCFVGDMICLLVLLPLSAMSIYLCGFGAHSYTNTHEWQATGLALLCLFLLVAFLLWSGLTFRFHYLRFRDWQRSNLLVKMVMNSQEQESDSRIASQGSQQNNPSEIVIPERYTSTLHVELGYAFDLNTLHLGLSGNGIVETRL